MMKAVQFHNQTMYLVECPLPEVSGEQVLVKVLMAGICATDIELFHGYQDFRGIPGHEFAGLVEKAPAAPWLEGKRVAAEINMGCGTCMRCLGGDARHCPDRQAVGIRGKDGAFAEYLALPLDNLVVLPDHLETIDAVFAEPVAAALEISQQVHIRNSMRVAVLGDGRLGQLCAMALHLCSARVTLFGRHEKKLSIAEKAGIATSKSAPAGGEGAADRSAAPFDLVVEATGNPKALSQALHMVRPEGTIVVKTTSRRSEKVNLSELVAEEITLIGSRCGDVGFAVKCLAEGWIQPAPLVEAVYPFSDFGAAFAHARSRGALKVLVAME